MTLILIRLLTSFFRQVTLHSLLFVLHAKSRPNREWNPRLEHHDYARNAVSTCNHKSDEREEERKVRKIATIPEVVRIIVSEYLSQIRKVRLVIVIGGFAIAGLSLMYRLNLPTHALVLGLVVVGVLFSFEMVDEEVELQAPARRLSLFRISCVIRYTTTMKPIMPRAIQTETKSAITGMMSKVSMYPTVKRILAQYAIAGLVLGFESPAANRMDIMDDKMNETLIAPKSQTTNGMKNAVPCPSALSALMELYWPTKRTSAANANAPMKLETRMTCL
jgi:hypothetical protein